MSPGKRPVKSCPHCGAFYQWTRAALAFGGNIQNRIWSNEGGRSDWSPLFTKCVDCGNFFWWKDGVDVRERGADGSWVEYPDWLAPYSFVETAHEEFLTQPGLTLADECAVRKKMWWRENGVYESDLTPFIRQRLFKNKLRYLSYYYKKLTGNGNVNPVVAPVLQSQSQPVKIKFSPDVFFEDGTISAGDADGLRALWTELTNAPTVQKQRAIILTLQKTLMLLPLGGDQRSRKGNFEDRVYRAKRALGDLKKLCDQRIHPETHDLLYLLTIVWDDMPNQFSVDHLLQFENESKRLVDSFHHPENVERFTLLLDENNHQEKLMKAEALRTQGKFDASLQLLSTIAEPARLVEEMKRRCRANNTAGFEATAF